MTRALVLANIVAFLIVLMAFLFGGLIIAKRETTPLGNSHTTQFICS